MTDCDDDNDGSCTWASLIPTSFNSTLYIPSLKISVTAGSFIRYTSVGDEAMPHHVGRVIEIVASEDLVPGPERPQFLQHVPPPNQYNDDRVVVQYAKVNIFKDSQLFCGSNFQVGDDPRLLDGYQRIFQLNKYKWIPSYLIVGLTFVSTEDDAYDDCQGMSNFYVAKHRITEHGHVSVIPRHTCPPFPGRIKSFCEVWSVDHCELIFNSIRQIRQEIQRILCRVAQSQGDFAMKNAKLQLPSCSWFFIKNTMNAKGIDSNSAVKYTRPQILLSWGLVYHSCRHTGYLEVLRFDTSKKLEVFRSLFGKMAGFGVRKTRPKYSDGRVPLSLNDVLNVVVCPSKEDDATVADDTSECSLCPFQRFGITEDGIDLSYDSLDGTLLISLRYRKVVVTNESLQSLAGVGVCVAGTQLHPSSGACVESSNKRISAKIFAGMEFIDQTYVMRVHKVRRTEIHAKKVYKIHNSRTTTKVNECEEVVVYTDVENVYQKIQEMLE